VVVKSELPLVMHQAIPPARAAQQGSPYGDIRLGGIPADHFDQAGLHGSYVDLQI
jgi:hypothetical protein